MYKKITETENHTWIHGDNPHTDNGEDAKPADPRNPTPTNTKTYDNTISAAAVPTITTGSLAGGDTANFSETYDTKAASTGKTLTPAGSVNDGNSGNNYAVTLANNTTGVITAKALTVSGITVNNKVYDATTAATLNTASA